MFSMISALTISLPDAGQKKKQGLDDFSHQHIFTRGRSEEIIQCLRRVRRNINISGHAMARGREWRFAFVPQNPGGSPTVTKNSPKCANSRATAVPCSNPPSLLRPSEPFSAVAMAISRADAGHRVSLRVRRIRITGFRIMIFRITIRNDSVAWQHDLACHHVLSLSL